jgi:hypothetical protein
MQPAIHKGALLAGALTASMALPVAGFAHPLPHPHAKEKAHKIVHKLAHKPPIKHATFAVTYTGEASKKASISNTGFWLNGGSVDTALTFRHGLGLAANLSVVHAHDNITGTTIGKTTIVFGPRYTKDLTDWTRKRKWLKKEDWFKRMPPSEIFAEALFGIAHAFDGAYPENAVINSSATSGAIQLGVGVDVTIWKHFGARVFELDYVRTNLANGAANNQNDLRLSFGVNYTWDAPTPPPAKPVSVAAVPAEPPSE